MSEEDLIHIAQGVLDHQLSSGEDTSISSEAERSIAIQEVALSTLPNATEGGVSQTALDRVVDLTENEDVLSTTDDKQVSLKPALEVEKPFKPVSEDSYSNENTSSIEEQQTISAISTGNYINASYKCLNNTKINIMLHNKKIDSTSYKEVYIFEKTLNFQQFP